MSSLEEQLYGEQPTIVPAGVDFRCPTCLVGWRTPARQAIGGSTCWACGHPGELGHINALLRHGWGTS
jgi:hypothetical protein